MAQERPVTPEKQLLKLIEVPKSGGNIESRAIRRRGLSYLSIGAWKGRISFFKDKLTHGFGGAGVSRIELSVLNKALYAVISLLIFYSAINLVRSAVDLKTMPGLRVKMQNGVKSIAVLQGLSALKESGYYLEKVRRKDIFKMGPKEAIQQQQAARAPAKTATLKIIDATQHLKLVGISWSRDPDAIIEDTKAMRTFFVKRGHMLGDVRVEAILKDKVVLSYGGEETELK